MTKHLAILIAFLMMIGSQVSAKDYELGAVFYCNEEVSAFVNVLNDWKLKQTRPAQFRFTLVKQADGSAIVKFGSSGYFKDTQMTVKRRDWKLEAADSYSMFVLADGRFTYGGANDFNAFFRTGTCDKF